jgi:hypothetical protein
VHEFISGSSILLHLSPCFCASTMLFLLLWWCCIVWSQVLWYLQHCTFCSVLPWQFTVFFASKWTLGLIFQSLWRMSLKVWWKLHCTCRMLLLLYQFSLYWFYQSMSMKDIFIIFSLLWFLSSMVYRFTCRGLLHPLLSLFLSILFFQAILNEIIFLHSFSICSLLVNRKATYFCKLIL